MHSVVAMVGWPEIIGLLIIVVVVFGAKYVPNLVSGMRHGIHEFMEATRSVQEVWETESDAEEGKGFHRYGFKFWLIVALGVTALCAAAVVLRELLE